MPFDWNDYLELATRIHQNPRSNEALKRTAISRAYYAVFHIAGQHAQAQGWTGLSVRGGSHSALPQWYRNQVGNVTYQNIGTSLRGLRNLREECDYQDSMPNLDNNLTYAISEANEIKNTLDGFGT